MPLRVCRSAVALSLATFAMLVVPVALDRTAVSPLFDLSAHAGNGNGNGGGNGNSGGDHGNSGGDHGNSGGNSDSAGLGNSGNNGNGFPHRKKSGEDQTFGASGEGDTTHRNASAERAGLNSLKRNINGLMNSADPRMDGIREFIIANADLQDAQAKLEDASDTFNDARLAYLALINDLGVGGYEDVSPNGLNDRVDEINDLLTDPDLTDEEIAELEDERTLLEDALTTINASDELSELRDALDAVGDAEDEVARLGEATGDDALKDALVMAANDNREVTDDVFNWASNRLDDLVDDYLASQ